MAKIRNNSSRIYCIGDANVIPGADPVEVKAADLEHFEIKAAIEKKDLVVEDETDKETGSKSLEDMTIAELKAYAAEKEIDLGVATRKDDILAAIKAAEAEGTGE